MSESAPVEDNLESGPGIPRSAARRRFLRRGAIVSGSVATGGAFGAGGGARGPPPFEPEWSRVLGAPILASPYGVPSRHESNVERRQSPGLTRTAQSSVAFT